MDIAQTTPATASSAAPAAAKPRITSDFDTFLQMLTAQMKNQDPLNPIESADFATQLATFSSVEQAVLTNDLLRGLMSQTGLADYLHLLMAWRTDYAPHSPEEAFHPRFVEALQKIGRAHV